MRQIDILGFGAVSIDDLVFIHVYPSPDQKMQVIRRERQGGGQTATALVAASRLGLHCAYAGVLGEDELSNAAARCMEMQGIDLAFLARRPAAQPIYAVILVDQAQGTRNIFFDTSGVVGAAEDWPPEEVIQSCKVLFVDQFGMPGMLRAARIARKAGIPVVSDLESDSPLFEVLSAEIDHQVFSWEFARKKSGAGDPADAARSFWAPEHAAVVITCGAEGCWYISKDCPDQARHFPAFPVEVVDTTGCGDVFHGAYAAGLIQGLEIEERIRFASAAAAIKAMSSGGQAGAPTLAQVEAFLKERT